MFTIVTETSTQFVGPHPGIGGGRYDYAAQSITAVLPCFIAMMPDTPTIPCLILPDIMICMLLENYVFLR